MPDPHRSLPAQKPAVDFSHEWKQLTLHANTLFEHGALDGAIEAYLRAREWVLEHFNQWPNADDAVTALVVSCLNLSEGLARAGRVAEAAAMLCSVHGGMLRAAGDQRLPQAVRHASRSRLRETYAALLRFQAVHGERPEIARWLHQGCACAARTSRSADGDGCDTERPTTLH